MRNEAVLLPPLGVHWLAPAVTCHLLVQIAAQGNTVITTSDTLIAYKATGGGMVPSGSDAAADRSCRRRCLQRRLPRHAQPQPTAAVALGPLALRHKVCHFLILRCLQASWLTWRAPTCSSSTRMA